MSPILVPVDYSKNSTNAMQYALALAAKTKAEVILFHSYEIPTAPLNVPMADISYGLSEIKKSAEEGLEKQVMAARKLFPKLKISSALLTGISTSNITEFAKRKRVKLIVMGTTGQGAVSRMLFGSTTAKVLSSAPCPVLAIPPGKKFDGISNITVATDLEKGDSSGLRKITELAKNLKADLTLFHVYSPTLSEVSKNSIIKKMETMKKNLAYKKTRIQATEFPDVTLALNAYIRKNKPELLAMITHHRNFPESIWKPSMTKKLSNYINIPLLSLKKENK